MLPGGLTRVSTEPQSLVVSMQLGGGSKDTWVQGAGERTPAARLPLRHQDVAQGSTNLSSRVADNLFWLGRYAERLETHVRLIRALLPGETDRDRATSAEVGVSFLGGLRLVPRESLHGELSHQWWSLQRLLSQMVFDSAHPTGVGWNLRRIRRLSFEVKERLSQDTWRVLQQLDAGAAAGAPSHPDRLFVAATSRAGSIVVGMAAFAGLLADTPARGHGWRFLEIGRRIERGVQMLELLRVGVATAPYPDDAHLEVLLQVADSATTYRSRY